MILFLNFQLKSDPYKHLLTDNEPQFLDGPYKATIPEMSAEGTRFHFGQAVTVYGISY